MTKLALLTVGLVSGFLMVGAAQAQTDADTTPDAGCPEGQAMNADRECVAADAPDSADVTETDTMDGDMTEDHSEAMEGEAAAGAETDADTTPDAGCPEGQALNSDRECVAEDSTQN